MATHRMSPEPIPEPTYSQELLERAKETGVWRKRALAVENAVYEALGHYPNGHPRIVPSHGHDPVNFELILEWMPNRDLLRYLWAHPNIPAKTRMLWAVEIAEGMAHLHSQKIVWNDAHFGNILLTNDLHVVLCDFGQSLINPPSDAFSDWGPPLPFLAPRGVFCTPAQRDVFAFGVLFFVLACQRFPHCSKTLEPSFTETHNVYNLHNRRVFEPLRKEAFLPFANVVFSCYKMEYKTAQELLVALQNAHNSWLDALQKGDIPDPDEVHEAISVIRSNDESTMEDSTTKTAYVVFGIFAIAITSHMLQTFVR